MITLSADVGLLMLIGCVIVGMLIGILTGGRR